MKLVEAETNDCRIKSTALAYILDDANILIFPFSIVIRKAFSTARQSNFNRQSLSLLPHYCFVLNITALQIQMYYVLWRIYL